jgi:HSP20 family molecular chaperone IbpA
MEKNTLITPFGDLTEVFKLFDKSIDNLDQIFQNKKVYTNYPPSNIYINPTENTYLIELSVAGWDKDEIEIFVQGGDSLHIVGSKGKKFNNISEDWKTIHSTIASRNFTKDFAFSLDIKDLDVKLTNGILSIEVFFKDKTEDKKIFNIK